MRLLLPWLLLAALVAGTQCFKDYSDYQVIRAHPEVDGHVRFLETLMRRSEFDFWQDGVGKGRPVDIMATRDHISELQSLLNVYNIKHSIRIDNVQDGITAEREANDAAREANKGKAFDYSYYMTYDEITQFYTELMANCTALNPKRCTSIPIGSSFEGRPQYVFKITNGDEMEKEKLWVDAGIHAREWISPAVGQFFTENMVYGYESDMDVIVILNSYDFYILPDVNPDGYVYSHEQERMWRRNRRPLDEVAVGCYGVDVNRNYDNHWDDTGAGPPCSDTYPGTGPFSEAESSNQNSIMTQLMNTGYPIVYFLTLHSYSQLWMTPYGYTHTNPDNLDELLRVAGAGVAALEAVNGVNYVFGEASDILGYATSGTSRDWAAGTMNIRFVFTIELRPENDPPGFELPPIYIQPTVTETWAGYKASVFEMLNGAKK